MRFLCVDDDPVFLKIIVGRLREQGYDDVVTAESGQSVLNLLRDGLHDVDCFLIDIQMPGMNGIDLVRYIRAMDVYQKTPIVMVTQMADKMYVDGAFSAGATDYLTKPLDELEFKSRIAMVQRLHDERQMNAVLRAQNGTGEREAPPVDFDKPLLIPELENAVEYLALENYLLTLGKKRLLGCMSLAIRFSEAEFFHKLCGSDEYLDVLTDVAYAIFDGLKSHEFVIAYAGSGLFVAFFPNRIMIDAQQTQEKMNFTLSQLQGAHAMDHLPPMRVEMGEPVENSIFTPGRADKMLQRALSRVKKLNEPDISGGRLLSA